MSLEAAVGGFFSEWNLTPSIILVAASAGPDSTALLSVLHETKDNRFDLEAAHINHHLRGEESDLDELWITEFCRQRGIPLVVESGSLDEGQVRERGIEAAARSVRYQLLRRIRTRIGADCIATGHQMNDQAETLLMRLTDGSGIDRLQGIRPVTRDGIIRPLLSVARHQIDDYLAAHEIRPRHDRSNDDLRFRRNRIRNEVLPLLQTLNPRIVETLSETARQARGQARIIEEHLDELAVNWIRGENHTTFHVQSLPSEPWAAEALVLREIRRLHPAGRDITKAGLRDIVRAIPGLGRRTISRDVEILRRSDRVTIRRILPSGAGFEEIIVPGVTVEIPHIDAIVRLSRIDGPVPSFSDAGHTRQVFQVSPCYQGERFAVRSRRTGDRFQPLGLLREKKLNEFLIDRKIPVDARDKLPLLTCDEKIVWVGGVEVSEGFRVTDSPGDRFEVSVTYHSGNDDS